METIKLTLPVLPPINVVGFSLNLLFCVAASFLLRYFYIRKSISLSGKFHIGTVIPILAIVTFLVIMVVKSSLALSLGLVGALSVIRFRTPIKEPEELVYLFLAIALGLGYGAGQTIVTSIILLVLLVVIQLWLSRKEITREDEYNILIDWTNTNASMSEILDRVTPFVEAMELRKYTESDQEKSVFLKVDARSISDIERLSKAVRDVAGGVACTIHEARPLQ